VRQRYACIDCKACLIVTLVVFENMSECARQADCCSNSVPSAVTTSLPGFPPLHQVLRGAVTCRTTT
jgi:hypothetical protein